MLFKSVDFSFEPIRELLEWIRKVNWWADAFFNFKEIVIGPIDIGNWEIGNGLGINHISSELNRIWLKVIACIQRFIQTFQYYMSI